MSNFVHGLTDATCQLAPDATYPSVLVSTLRRAERRCLCSLFIIDVSGEAAPIMVQVLDALEEAAWLGTDVRVLVGGSRSNYLIAERAAGARAAIADRGISCRWLTATERRGSHAKLVIADDTVLLGSHNWSPGAFTGQIQDSVLIASSALAAFMARTFEEQWMRAEV